MSDFKGLEQMQLPYEGPPDWRKEWGPEVGRDIRILDQTFGYTRGKPVEYRNTLLRVVKEELIPIYERFRNAIRSEHQQIIDICQFYNKAETGVFNVILSDYDKFLEGLPARYPDLVTVIEESDDYYPVLVYGPGKTVCSSQDDVPTISMQYGNAIRGESVMAKSYKLMCGRLFKKAALQKQQTQILARALEENGLQLPPEFADIERQLDDLQQPGPEWPTQQPAEEAGKRQDPSPDAAPFALIQPHPDRPEFTGVYVNRAKPVVMPTRPQMLSIHCKHLLDLLTNFRFSRSFLGPPTEEEAPGYFDVVRQHRDIPMIMHNIDETVGYCPRGFFDDLRLMIDNYCYFFDVDSVQHRGALLFEKKLLKKLPGWGEAGQTGMEQFKKAPRAEFNETYEMPDDGDFRSISDDDAPFQESEAENENDDTIDADERETSFAHNLNDQWASGYGDENDRNFDARNEAFNDQDGDSFEGSPINESTIVRGPSAPSAEEDNTIERAFGAFDQAKQYDEVVGNATRAPIHHDTQQPGGSFSARSPSPRLDDSEPGEQPVGDVSFYDTYPYPNPDSSGFALAPDETAGEAGAHANADSSHQPAPKAPMEMEQAVVDLTSLPQGQSSHTGAASTKRARDSDSDDSWHDSDDQESSDDDAPLAKRRKTAGKRPAAAVATSSRKRSRNDGDGDDEDQRAQPSKRQRSSSPPAQAPVPTVSAATDKHRSVSPQALEPAHAGSSRDVAADKPQPEAATGALGHTDQGTITATQLHKLPKWKKNARTKGRSFANRPWVFGFGFGEDYGLYVMSCPTKGCPKENVDTFPDVFRFHPLKSNDSDRHLRDCHGDLGDGSDADKVRKFCKQVISDDKKAVSIEWARKWNEDLINEYGEPDDRDLRLDNF